MNIKELTEVTLSQLNEQEMVKAEDLNALLGNCGNFIGACGDNNTKK